MAAKLQIHAVGLVLIILGLLSWVVALGGAGAASYNCQRSSSYELCAKEYQWEWWSLFFELCLLLALFVTVFLERAFQRGRAVFLTFFNLATMCVLLSAHDFITDVAIGPINVRDLGQDAVNAAAAGFVLLGITNFGLLIVLGRDFAAPPPAVPAYERPGMGGLGPHGIGFQSSAPV